jgi:hypothetical protein
MASVSAMKIWCIQIVAALSVSACASKLAMNRANERLEWARLARSTRNGEAPLLAAHAGR